MNVEELCEMVSPSWPYKGSKNIATLQRHLRLCWIVFVSSFIAWSSIYLLVQLVIPHTKNAPLIIGSILVLTVSVRACVMSVQYFVQLRDIFFEISLAKLAERLHKEDPSRHIHLKIMAFVRSSNLYELENALQFYILSEIKAVRVMKRKQRTEAEQARIKNVHDQIDQELNLAAQRMGSEQKIKKILRQNLSLSAKRSLMRDLARFTAVGGRGIVDNPNEDKVQKQIDYLIDISEGEPCPEALRLHALAKESQDFKSREKYLKQAIEAQRQVNRKPADKVEVIEEIREEQILDSVTHLSLWEYAREAFVVDDLLPAEIDNQMVTAILLLLIGPGTKARRFQAKYWPEASLKREVVRYYRRLLKSSYQPQVFDKTLKWLTVEGILHPYPKSDEMMYSLSSKTANAGSENSQEIIRRVIKACDLFKS